MSSLAEQIFANNPGIKNEDQVLDAGWGIMKTESGIKTARYYFHYHEDFPSDLVSEYFWLQHQIQVDLV
jgi:hypothetical protein